MTNTSESRAFQTVEPPFRRARRASLLALMGFLGLSLLVCLSSGAVASGNLHGWYETLMQPPGTPPSRIFAPVWTVFCLTLGGAAWLVWRRVDIAVHRKRAALRIWGWHLLLAAIWPSAFFGLHSPGLGMIAIALLLVCAALTTHAFSRLQRSAAWLLLPHVGWVCYMCYLNGGFVLLNGA